MKEINISELQVNPYNLFGKDWMALTAETEKDSFNTMTVALEYLGSHSGRNEDKIKATGLTPVFSDESTYFAEADLVFICRRLYQAPLLEDGYVDRELIDFNYPDKDFHEVYIGEIVKVLVADDRE